MYQEIGQISDATIFALQEIVDEVPHWEHHVSDITDHQAAPCTEQCQAIEELRALWPVDSWDQLSFMRLGPAGKLYRHHDNGFGFHIPIETNGDCISLSYENGVTKEQHLEVGKLYHVDRSIAHESRNDGDTDRTHLIVLLKESNND